MKFGIRKPSLKKSLYNRAYKRTTIDIFKKLR